MRVGVFIYGRTDSSRLPGKVLKPFGQVTLIEHVIERALQVHATDCGLLTTDRVVDDGLAGVADACGIDVVRGSATDLVARTVEAIDTLGVARFVRVNADSPLFEPRLVNACLDRRGDERFVSNLLERRFPYGVAVEVVESSLYVTMAHLARADELEHVTMHLYRRLRRGSILSLRQQYDHSHLHLAVDTQADYERMRSMFPTWGSRHAPYWELLGLQEPVPHWRYQ